MGLSLLTIRDRDVSGCPAPEVYLLLQISVAIATEKIKNREGTRAEPVTPQMRGYSSISGNTVPTYLN